MEQHEVDGEEHFSPKRSPPIPFAAALAAYSSEILKHGIHQLRNLSEPEASLRCNVFEGRFFNRYLVFIILEWVFHQVRKPGFGY